MPDTPQKPEDVSAIFNERRKTRDIEITAMNEVESAIKGILPEDLKGLFTKSDVRLQLRTIRAADDGLTKFLSEIPILPHADSLGKRESDSSRNKAETVEKAIYGYHNGSALRGGAPFSGIRFQLARHQVRFGDGCLLVHPDYERKLVFYEVKDPRCLYLPTGYHPFSMTPLDGALLVYEMTLGEAKRRYAYDSYGVATDVLQRLNNAFKPSFGYGGDFQSDDSQMVRIGAYRSREAWYMVALSETDVVLMQSETGDRNHPGVCGVTSFKQFASEPLFLGQIGLEAGLEKVINQQIQNTERQNKATSYGPPLLNDTKVIGGYNEINYALLQGRTPTFFREAPDSPGNLTQVMGTLLQMAQMFNYNPESNQGQGNANSGKALQQLQAGPRSLVTNILFSPYEVAFPRAYDDSMEMELNLWPNDRKTAYGRNGRQSFEVDYTPSAALQGYRGRVKIEEARPGGYNAYIEAQQKKDGGLASRRDVLEADPDVRDVEQTIRRIEAEANEQFTQAAFEALGGQDPLLAIRASTEIDKRIGSGKSRSEAIREMVAEGFFEPPAPDPMAAPPPELAAMLGGGEGLAGPPPSLSAVRGL